jgi:hypothetical protein
MEWISVNDRLPELTESDRFGAFTKPMLCLHIDGHHEDCILHESDEIDDAPYWSYVQDGDCCSTVTHWMPLPEAPK